MDRQRSSVAGKARFSRKSDAFVAFSPQCTLFIRARQTRTAVDISGLDRRKSALDPLSFAGVAKFFPSGCPRAPTRVALTWR